MSTLARARVWIPTSARTVSSTKPVSSLSRSFSQRTTRSNVSSSARPKPLASTGVTVSATTPDGWHADDPRIVRLYSSKPAAKEPNFAFAFDIDGVLLHKSKPIKGAVETLKYLQQHRIPFIFLTNGGGKPEAARVAELSDKLDVPLDTSNFVQSHTPYQLLAQEDLNKLNDPDSAELVSYLRHQVGVQHLRDSTVLVLGSDASAARHIAHGYGFTSVVTPADIITAHPEIFPFDPLREYYAKQEILPLPKPLYDPKKDSLHDCLKIDAILVFNDPRDWAVDIQLITDLLFSHRGYLGTYSSHCANSSSTDHPSSAGSKWQADGQPALIFSNCDLLWSTGYHLPRFGQGAFRNAVRAEFNALVANAEGDGDGATTYQLKDFTFGKPHRGSYAYAQGVMLEQFGTLHHPQQDSSSHTPAATKCVWMIGDNPESDIRGAIKWNRHLTTAQNKKQQQQRQQHTATNWKACLVKTGVWDEERVPLHRLPDAVKPHMVAKDVRSAVNAIFKRENWPGQIE